MKIEAHDNEHVANLIEESANIAVFPAKVSGPDSFCAGVGLYNMLVEKEKNVYFVYPWKIPLGCENLMRREALSSNVGNRELLVSIDYKKTPATKAHYHTEDDVLYVRIGPVSRDFDRNRVRTKITGFDFDLVFTLGVSELDDLGRVSTELEGEINNARVINIDNNPRNRRFGEINIVDPHAENLSMLLFSKASSWGLMPNKKAAKALLYGMTYRENGNVKVD